jgi:hypothetical protein
MKVQRLGNGVLTGDAEDGKYPRAQSNNLYVSTFSGY